MHAVHASKHCPRARERGYWEGPQRRSCALCSGIMRSTSRRMLHGIAVQRSSFHYPHALARDTRGGRRRKSSSRARNSRAFRPANPAIAVPSPFVWAAN
jgi:hypothetical protein